MSSFFFETLNSEDAIEILGSRNLSIGVVFGTGKLNPEVINQFSDYLMNIHRGIPQKYRGLDSHYWAIYHRDFNSVETCMHLAAHKLDTGKILYANMTLRGQKNELYYFNKKKT